MATYAERLLLFIRLNTSNNWPGGKMCALRTQGSGNAPRLSYPNYTSDSNAIIIIVTGSIASVVFVCFVGAGLLLPLSVGVMVAIFNIILLSSAMTVSVTAGK